MYDICSFLIRNKMRDANLEKLRKYLLFELDLFLKDFNQVSFFSLVEL